MHLTVLRGPELGGSFPLSPGEQTAGRSADNPIHLPSSHVSGCHCSFILQDDVVTVRDLGSTNGVYVEGHRIGEAVLGHGQRVQVGDWLLALEDEQRQPDPKDAGAGPAEQVEPGPPGGFGVPPDRSVTRPRSAVAAEAPPAEAPPFGAPEVAADAGFGEVGPALPPPASPPPPPPQEPALGFQDGLDLTAPEGGDETGSYPGEVAPVSGGFGAPAAPGPGPADPPMAPQSPPAEQPVQPQALPSQAPVNGAPSGGFGAPVGAPPAEPGMPPAGGFGAAAEPAPGPPPGVAPPSDSFGDPSAAPYDESGGAGFGTPTGGGFGMGAQGALADDPGVPGAAFGEPPPGTATEAGMVEPEVGQDWLSKLRGGWRRLRRFPWSLQLGGVMLGAAFILLVAPVGGLFSQVLRSSSVAEEQVLERGKALAIALAARNTVAIAEQNNLRLDAEFLLGEPGVKLCMITNEQGVVRAPPEKVRQSLAGKDYFAEANTRGRIGGYEKGGGVWHILAPIRVAPVEGAPASIQGWAYLLFDVESAVSESTPMLGRLLAVMIVLGAVMGGTWLTVWRLAASPVAMVREELELAMRGHVPTVAIPMDWSQLRELTHSINRLLVRWKKAAAGAPRISETGEELAPLLATTLEDLVVPAFLLRSAGGAADEEQPLCIAQASDGACQWLGCGREALVGRHLGEVLPDPMFLDTLKAAYASVASGQRASAAEQVKTGTLGFRIRILRAGNQILGIVTVG